jgi:hypothetical protein
MGTVNRPEDLYTFDESAPTVPTGLHLVAGLTGFADAGSAVAQVTTSILERLDTRLVAEFDPDALLDGSHCTWCATRSGSRSSSSPGTSPTSSGTGSSAR